MNEITTLLNSTAWKRIKKHLDGRIDYLLNSLYTCPPDDIKEFRGQIKAIKQLLDTLESWSKE